jgi:hypothetical protein
LKEARKDIHISLLSNKNLKKRKRSLHFIKHLFQA